MREPGENGRLSADDLVHHLREVAARGGAADEVLVHEERIPAREPSFGVLRPRLPAPLATALLAQGVRQLYAHQVAAIQAARAGQDAVITTPTASGKTLCFNLPVLERVLQSSPARAIYLYPTKALLVDQLRGLRDLVGALEPEATVRVARLDGDVPASEREALRASPPNVLLANPDIVHHDLLLRHRRWRGFLANLQFVVLDELHSYRGVFGANVGLILRRLLRLAAREGATPTIIAASATIANPAELAGQLTGRAFVSISGEEAGARARRFILWRPPLRGSAEHNEHRGATTEAVGLFVELLRSGRTAILFGRSRIAVERMLAQAREALEPDLARRISGYKAGYTPEERRRIESDLREGRLRGVVATNALELGIDVGALDAAILAGYPGSVMSTWQQAGRVGRRDGDEALIILVAADDALDQYYLSHPSVFFGQPVEQAVADPGNESILLAHLLCAAHEAPLREDELRFFPTGTVGLIDRMVCERLLAAGDPWRLADVHEVPHRHLSIRGVSRDPYRVVDESSGRTIATAEPPHLYREAHPGAVYLHQGSSYRVVALDGDAGEVRVRREAGGARTDPLSDVRISPRGDQFQRRQVMLGAVAAEANIGPILVEEVISSYRETAPGVRVALTRTIEPPLRSTLETVGVWLDLPEALGAEDDALHALEHALMNALPIVLLADRRDVGSGSDGAANPGGRVYLFDSYEGGIGLAEKAYALLDTIVGSAAELIRTCRCASGCPSCVHLPGCSRGNDGLDKAGGLALLSGRSIAARPRPGPRAATIVPGTHEADLQSRLRRIAEASLRERLGPPQPLRAGEVVDYLGFGPVTVLEVVGERAYVQFARSSARTWAPLTQIRRKPSHR